MFLAFTSSIFQLCSQKTLHIYLIECQNYVQQTTDACYEKWAWNYDGRSPSFFMPKLSSDDESTTNCNGVSNLFLDGLSLLSNKAPILGASVVLSA